MSIIVHELENEVWSATYLDEKIVWDIINVDTKESVNVGGIDGYNFGDRLFEGVLFTVEVLPDKRGFRVSSKPEDYDYLKTLNMNRWMYEAADSAATMDCLDYGIDSNLGDLAWRHMVEEAEKELDEEEQTNGVQAPIVVPATTVEDLLNHIFASMPKPAETTDLNKDVHALLKPLGFDNEEKIENLARVIAQADNFYEEGEDKELTDEDWLKRLDADKFRWIARYIFNKMGE